jgi:hypothetical protein
MPLVPLSEYAGTPIAPTAAVAAPGGATSRGQASLGRGVVMGVIAAALVGVGWYLIAVAASVQLSLFAVAVGVAVAYSVTVGTGRAGMDVSIASVAVTTLAVVVVEYFVVRHFHGVTVVAPGSAVPLWLGIDRTQEMVASYVEASPGSPLFLGASLLAGFRSASTLGRR